MPSAAEMEAELKLLEAELQKKQLEAQVKKLELELARKKAAEEPQAEAEYYTTDEEIFDEEYVEEYYDDEVVEEEYVEEPTQEGEASSPLMFPYKTNVSIGEQNEQKKRGVMDRWTNRQGGNNSSGEGKIEGVGDGESKTGAQDNEAPPVIYSTEPALAGKPFRMREIPREPGPSPAGEEGPIEQMLGPTLFAHNKLVRRPTAAAVAGMDFVLLYVASKWNRECKAFFPTFLDFYRTATAQNKIECVYISHDRSLQDFKDIFGRMPFPAMPTQTAHLKNRIASDLKLIDTPALVVLEATTGLVVTTHGVQDVASLQRNNEEDANNLINTWKCITPITAEEVVMDVRLKHGKLERSPLYWQT